MWRRHGSAPAGLLELIDGSLRSHSIPDDQPTSPGLDPISRYEALLRESRAIARHTSVAELLRAISEQLHFVVPFDYLMLILHDAQMDEMRLVVLERRVSGPRRRRASSARWPCLESSARSGCHSGCLFL